MADVMAILKASTQDGLSILWALLAALGVICIIIYIRAIGSGGGATPRAPSKRGPC